MNLQMVNKARGEEKSEKFHVWPLNACYRNKPRHPPNIFIKHTVNDSWAKKQRGADSQQSSERRNPL